MVLILTFILLFLALRRSWEISSKNNKHIHSNSKERKGALSKQQQAARLVTALTRVTVRAERLEGEKAALEYQIGLLTTTTPVVRPPHHVINLATASCNSIFRPMAHQSPLMTLYCVQGVCQLCVV